MEDGPSRFRQGSTCPAVLRNFLRETIDFQVRGYHPLWPAFPCRSPNLLLCNSPGLPQQSQKKPYNPNRATLAGLHTAGLGCSPFARRYLENRCCFLVLGVLRCFSSPGSPPPKRIPGHEPRVGFPIRKSTDLSLFDGSPWLIAAYHVLRRLLAPRHPPYALSSLITFCLRQHSASLRSMQLSKTGNFWIRTDAAPVEAIGIEPTTFCVQGRCSPS